MKYLSLLFLLLLPACGSEDLPQIVTSTIRRAHVNDPRTALYIDLVPRNSSGAVTNLGGGLGTTTNRWNNVFTDEVSIGDPTDLNKINSTGQNQIFETNDIVALTLNSAQEADFGLGVTEKFLIDGEDEHIRGVDDIIVIIDSDNGSTTAAFKVMADATTAGGATEIMAVGEDSTISMNVGNPVIKSNNALILRGDADASSSTGVIVQFQSNASDVLGSFGEQSGGNGITFSVGTAGVASGDTLRFCLSSDCTADISIRNELETSMWALVYDDGGSNNGIIIQNEDTSPSGTDLIQLDFSVDDIVIGENFIVFHDADGEIGSISADSSNSVAFNTSSDARLKENERPIPDPLDTILAIQPYEFEWVRGGDTAHGMYAQELQEVYPLAVSGDPNGDVEEAPMSVAYSKLIPVLIAAVQELHIKVEMLEDELTTLKGSALVAKILRGSPVQVNDYRKPNYVSQPAKEIACIDIVECRTKYEDFADGHCGPTFFLHIVTDTSPPRTYLNCRKVTGYTQKSRADWERQ